MNIHVLYVFCNIPIVKKNVAYSRTYITNVAILVKWLSKYYVGMSICVIYCDIAIAYTK